MLVLKRLTFGLMTFLCVGVAVVSARYLAPGMPGGAPPVTQNAFADPWLVWHAGAALTALAIGPFQFLRRRDGKRGAGHRALGAVYICACLVGAVSGFLLSIGTTAGPIAALGFGALAVAWFGANTLGLSAVLTGRYEEHRRWMIRSFALTLAAVTLRLYMPLAAGMGLDMGVAYVAISYLCWIPNIVVAELFSVPRRQPRLRPQPA